MYCRPIRYLTVLRDYKLRQTETEANTDTIIRKKLNNKETLEFIYFFVFYSIDSKVSSDCVEGPHSETGSACFYSHPGVNRPLPVDYFRILRVAYLKPMGDLLVDLPVFYPLTFETFTPEVVRSKEFGNSQKERLEKMNETFSKVITFLQTSGKTYRKSVM